VNPLKKLASHLPASWQQEMKRLQYRGQIRLGTFSTSEPEFVFVEQLIAAGDWVIDIGANVGHYTKKFSDLVGPKGRVIAVEPVPDTFALLAANVAAFRHRNVTLLNVAASDKAAIVGMQIPDFTDTGLKNYYRAALTAEASELEVLTVALDALAIDRRIALIKIDTEGHDPIVLAGLEQLLARDHPILIVEMGSAAVVEHLNGLGYASEKLPGSPNTLFRSKWI
jgi:FkbM family methyltransferase